MLRIPTTSNRGLPYPLSHSGGKSNRKQRVEKPLTACAEGSRGARDPRHSKCLVCVGRILLRSSRHVDGLYSWPHFQRRSGRILRGPDHVEVKIADFSTFS